MQCFSCMVMFATYLRKRSGTLTFWLSQSRHITFASALILCLGEKNSVEPAMRITEAIIEWPVDRDSQVPRMAFGTSTDNQKADKQAASLSIPNSDRTEISTKCCHDALSCIVQAQVWPHSCAHSCADAMKTAPVLLPNAAKSQAHAYGLPEKFTSFVHPSFGCCNGKLWPLTPIPKVLIYPTCQPLSTWPWSSWRRKTHMGTECHGACGVGVNIDPDASACVTLQAPKTCGSFWARGVRAMHSPEVLLREHHPQKFTQEPQNLSSHDAKEMCLVIFFAYVFVGAKDGYLKLHSWCPCWQKDTHADRLRTTSTSSDKREATCTARISACIGRQDRMISSNHAEGSWCQCLLEELEAMNLPISRHCHWLISAEFKHHLKALSIQLRGYTSSISLRLGEAAPALKTIKGFRLHGTMVKADLKCWTQNILELVLKTPGTTSLALYYVILQNYLLTNLSATERLFHLSQNNGYAGNALGSPGYTLWWYISALLLT